MSQIAIQETVVSLEDTDSATATTSETGASVPAPAIAVNTPTVQPVNLIEEAKRVSTGHASKLEQIRFDANQTVVIPFTPDGVKVQVHYLEDPEYRGYLRCNGPDCMLCRVGRNRDERTLLPVYQPISKQVGVISLSQSMRPGALKPQLLTILSSTHRKIAIIRKADQMRFEVVSDDLRPGIDDGAAMIAAFEKRRQAGEVDLASIFPLYSNQMLACMTSIATLMQIKGIQL